MSADLLAVLVTVGAATLGAAASWAVVRLVGWLLARRRRARRETWEIRCHRCDWSGLLEADWDLQGAEAVRTYMGIHHRETGHLVEARTVER